MYLRYSITKERRRILDELKYTLYLCKAIAQYYNICLKHGGQGSPIDFPICHFAEYKITDCTEYGLFLVTLYVVWPVWILWMESSIELSAFKEI